MNEITIRRQDGDGFVVECLSGCPACDGIGLYVDSFGVDQVCHLPHVHEGVWVQRAVTLDAASWRAFDHNETVHGGGLRIVLELQRV